MSAGAGERRRRVADRGAAAAEFAAVLPAVVLVLALLAGAAAAGVGHLRALDAARGGAREIARGEDLAAVVEAAEKRAGDGAAVEVDESGGYATVTVTVPTPDLLAPVLPEVSAEATARLERSAQ